MGSQPDAAPAFDLTSGFKLGMGPVLPVFPLLVPTDWPGRSANVCRPLLSDPTLEDGLLISFAYLGQGMRMFVSPDRLMKLDRTLDQVQEEALGNLKKRPGAWRIAQLPLADGHTLPLAVCDTDLLAAERILDESFLRAAGEMLDGAVHLAVGVPHRGVIVAADLAQSDDLIFLKYAVQQWYAEGGDEALSPWLFLVMHGMLMGVVRFDDQLNLPMP